MSKERELLRKILKANDEGYLSFLGFASLKNEIQKLLAQPERNWVEYQRGHSTAVLELKRNLENIFIGMGL